MIGGLAPKRVIKKTSFLPVLIAFTICVFVAFMHVNVAGRVLSLLCLPLLFVALWPRNLNAQLSILIFLFAGLFVDWGSAGAPGQWALVYLAVFAVTRPDQRLAPLSFWLAIRNWFVAVVIAAIILIVSGSFVYGVWPNFAVLAWQFGAMTALLPILYLFRRVMYYIFSHPDEMEF